LLLHFLFFLRIALFVAYRYCLRICYKNGNTNVTTKNKKGPEEYKCNLPNECKAKNKMKDIENDADISVGTRDRKT